MNDGKKISRISFLKLSGMAIGSILVGCSEQMIRVLEENTWTPDATTIITPPMPNATVTFTPTPGPTSVKIVPIEDTATLEGTTIREPINVSDADFETVVLQSGLPTIVEFWAPWCEPCKILDPILEKIADEYTGRLVVVRMNTDQDPLIAQQYGVVGIPSMIFISNGKVFHRQSGVLSEEMLRDLVEKFLVVVTK